MKKKIFVATLFAAAMMFLTTGTLAQDSPDCSTITDTSGGTLVNSAGTWSFSGTEVLLNGSQAAGGFGTLLLIYNGGNLYDDDAGGWFEWNGSGWNSEPGDPRGSGCSGEGPYGGTPWAIPGTVMSENYDTGGQGVGYSVNSVNGTDNSYRSDGVDLQLASSPATGNNVGWSYAGQWFRYTVNVATSGSYTVTFLVASPYGVTDAFHLANSSGTNLTGSVNVPNTGGWETWTTVSASLTLPAGVQTLTLDEDNGDWNNSSGWNIDDMVFSSSGGGGEGPYGGTPAAVPGVVQAENYDTGGYGVGYSATSNGTANSYRSDGDDLEVTSDAPGGYDVGWAGSGQWFRYTVNVASAGTYTVTFRVACPNGATDAFHIANSSGTNLSGSVNVPATGGYQNWTNVTATVSLSSGTQTLTLDEDNGGGWNIDYMTFASNAVSPNGVSAPSGYHWTTTFDDEFTSDSSLDHTKWNGGAGNTDWCDEDAGGEPAATYFFRENPSSPCAQVYTGLSFSSSGLTETSSGSPSAAIQTDGTTAQNALFIQEYGFFEASFKVPNMSDSGYSAHSDFWMHTNPMTGNDFAPEFDVGERPTWLGRGSGCNNPGTNNNKQMSFGVADGPYGSGNGVGAYAGDSAGDDLSNNYHTYAMWWNNDGSGPYGSIQMYLDGNAVFSGPYTLNSADSNVASGIYMLLSLDQDCPNDSDVNDSDPFIIQYVRVWRLDSN